MKDRAGAGYLRILVLALGLTLGACATETTTVSGSISPLPDPLAMFAPGDTDFRAPDNGTVQMQTGDLVSQFGCSVAYELHSPGVPTDTATASEQPSGLIVVGHGFMSNLSAMRGWAERWAGLGYRTAVVSFCNSTWLNGRHDRNAADMVAIANKLALPGEPVLYAGFSAGGLAALLAAAADERAYAYLGLDAVDSKDMAMAVANLGIPALFIYGEPSSCNADGNMVQAMPAARPLVAMRVPFATHCDFENPYNPGCAGVCGEIEPPEAARAVRKTIIALATAWVAAQMGGEAAAGDLFETDALAELERLELIRIVKPEV